MQRKGITVCMYQGNRTPPTDPNPYQPNYDYWEELAIKLVFVLAFENVIAVTKMILRWMIPDVPSTLRQNIRQHAYLTNELIMQQELARAKEQDHRQNSVTSE
jgi:anoctamin-1